MGKVLFASLALVLFFPSSAQAAKPVPYTNQAEGQFCKSADKGKKVMLPDGSSLTCKSDGSKFRWQAASFVSYVNQRKGQFCRKVDEGKKVRLPDGVILTCKADGSRTRWTAAQ